MGSDNYWRIFVRNAADTAWAEVRRITGLMFQKSANGAGTFACQAYMHPTADTAVQALLTIGRPFRITPKFNSDNSTPDGTLANSDLLFGGRLVRADGDTKTAPGGSTAPVTFTLEGEDYFGVFCDYSFDTQDDALLASATSKAAAETIINRLIANNAPVAEGIIDDGASNPSFFFKQEKAVAALLDIAQLSDGSSPGSAYGMPFSSLLDVIDAYSEISGGSAFSFVNDSSGNGFTGFNTDMVATLPNEHWSGFGKSLAITDGGSFAQILTDNVPFGGSTLSAFTLEWKFDAPDDQLNTIMDADFISQQDGTGAIDLTVRGNNTPRYEGYVVFDDSHITDLTYTGTSIAGKHEVALSYDGTTVRLYVDGTKRAEEAHTGTVSIGTGYAPFLAAPNTVGTTLYVEEVRFSRNARYTGASYTVATTPFTSDSNTELLWHFETPAPQMNVMLLESDSSSYDKTNPLDVSITDWSGADATPAPAGTVADSSGNGLDGYLFTPGTSGISISPSQWPGFSNALQDIAITPNTTAVATAPDVVTEDPSYIPFPTVALGSFFLEFKAYRNNATSTVAMRFQDNTDSPAKYIYLQLLSSTFGANNIHGQVSMDDGVSVSLDYAAGSITGTHDIGLSYDGTTFRLFLDGTVVDTDTHTSTLTFNTGNVLAYIIGESNDAISQMEEVRFSKVSRHTANYTPATSPFTTDSDTGLLWHFDSIAASGSYPNEDEDRVIDVKALINADVHDDVDRVANAISVTYGGIGDGGARTPLGYPSPLNANENTSVTNNARREAIASASTIQDSATATYLQNTMRNMYVGGTVGCGLKIIGGWKGVAYAKATLRTGSHPSFITHIGDTQLPLGGTILAFLKDGIEVCRGRLTGYSYSQDDHVCNLYLGIPKFGFGNMTREQQRTTGNFTKQSQLHAGVSISGTGLLTGTSAGGTDTTLTTIFDSTIHKYLGFRYWATIDTANLYYRIKVEVKRDTGTYYTVLDRVINQGPIAGDHTQSTPSAAKCSVTDSVTIDATTLANAGFGLSAPTTFKVDKVRITLFNDSGSTIAYRFDIDKIYGTV